MKKRIIILTVIFIVVLVAIICLPKNSSVKLKDKNKELVYEKEFNYIFQGAEWQETIPVINIDSEDADRINTEIEEKMINYYSIEYETKLNHNILSLLVSGDTEESIDFNMYRIDTYTGKNVNK